MRKPVPASAPCLQIPDAMGALGLIAWRHPKPLGAQARCIGRTDLPLDRRKAKRLAHRIRQAARRHAWPRVIHTSPLQRCALVGRYLRRWGWRHHVDPALLEMGFGAWDGRRWADIPRQEIDAWCASFADTAPGGGETLRTMAARVRAWHERVMQAGGPPCLLVAHAGWMLLVRWLGTHTELPSLPSAWPAPPAYGERWELAALMRSGQAAQ